MNKWEFSATRNETERSWCFYCLAFFVAFFAMNGQLLTSSWASFLFLPLLGSLTGSQFLDPDYVYQGWFNPSLGFRGPGETP